MAFEETEVGAQKGPRPDVAASISGPRVGTLRLILSFSDAGAERLGIEFGDRFRVLVGTGADAGRLRLVKRDDGNCQVTRIGRGGVGALVLGCGRHPSFGAPREQRPCVAEPFDEKTIAVTLPAEWPERGFSKQGIGLRKKTDAPAPAAPAPVRAAEPAATSAPRTPTKITENGITVSMIKGAEGVTVGRRGTTLTGQQAIIVAALAKSMPRPCGSAWLMNQLWVGKSPSEVSSQLDAIMKDLNVRLAQVGYRALFSGYGYVLQPIKGSKVKAA